MKRSPTDALASPGLPGPLPHARAAAIALIAALWALGCAPAPAVSLASLGRPRTAAVPDRTAVILGWASEERDGWSIDRVRIDDQGRPEWDGETQRPAVFYLRPGPRELRIYSSRPERDDDGARRVRSRPVRIDAIAGTVVVCTVRIGGEDGPALPRLSCQAGGGHVGPQPAAAAQPAPPVAAPSPGPQAPTAGCSGDEQILERLRSIEGRLEQLELLLRNRLGAETVEATEHPESQRLLHIDTTPPW